MKALIVVDMQKDFIDGALGTKEAIAIVPNVVNSIEEFNGLVYATMDTHGEDYLETQEGHYLPVPHCIKDSQGWQLNSEIAKALDVKGCNIIFEKNAFGSPKLAAHLAQEAAGLEEITLIGLCTDICVISNAMLIKANLPEVKITIDASCCAGVTPESHHMALQAMKSCQINIINE